MIASRFSTVAPRAIGPVVTASIKPYIEASRTPSPEGAITVTTATIAPTAPTPPRYGTALEVDVAAERADQEEDRQAAEDPRDRVVGDQPE